MKGSKVFEKVIRFCNACDRVYSYGNGHHGKAMVHFLKESGKDVDGVIVTQKNSSEMNVIEWKEIENNIKNNDGIILAMSNKNEKSLDLTCIKKHARVLHLHDWELNEIEKYEYYKMVGFTHKVGLIKYEIDRFVTKELRKKRQKSLRNKEIDEWHIISKREKKYCNDVVKYICEKNKGTEEGCIIELGCGLCDILADRRLKKYDRLGFDIDDEVIEEARFLYIDIDLCHGSFESVGQDRLISCLITINFLHDIPKEELRCCLKNIFEKNHVEYYIADEVSGNYRYEYRIDEVIPNGYVLDKVIGIYPSDGGVRTVKAFRLK